MDFGRAFTFITEDPDWVGKIAIGALIFLISLPLLGIPILVLLGYQVAIMRNVIQGEKYPLPLWDEWGRLFRDGLHLAIGLFVYSLPFSILLCLGWTVFLLPALGSGNDDLMAALGGLAALSWVVILCVAVLFAIALAFIAPAIFIQYVRKGELGAIFRFGEVLAIVRDNLSDILLILLAVIAANLVIQLVSTVLSITICGPFIISIVGALWLMLAQAHMYGQIARDEGYAVAPKAVG